MFFISIPRHVIWLNFLTRTVEDACPYKRVRSLCVCDVGRGFYSRRLVSLYIAAGANPRPANRIFRAANKVIVEKQSKNEKPLVKEEKMCYNTLALYSA